MSNIITFEQKKRLLNDHFVHEVVMLLFSDVSTQNPMYVNLGDSLPESLGKIVKPKVYNCFFEAFLIHARNLTEFFCIPPKKVDKDTASASHFFSAPKDWFETELVQHHKKILLIDLDVQEKTSKRLAHLTYSRVELKGGWCVDEISISLTHLAEAFLDKIDQGYFEENLKVLKEALSKESKLDQIIPP